MDRVANCRGDSPELYSVQLAVSFTIGFQPIL